MDRIDRMYLEEWIIEFCRVCILVCSMMTFIALILYGVTLWICRDDKMSVKKELKPIENDD